MAVADVDDGMVWVVELNNDSAVIVPKRMVEVALLVRLIRGRKSDDDMVVCDIRVQLESLV